MKDDRILQAKVRAALDDCLSGVDDMPSLRYDIMRKVRGEKPVKKKLSVGLIFAIVLILVALGAVAAVILSGKEFVEQELVPMVSESTSDQWTQEELDEILRIASENGLVLSDDILLSLRQGDGEYKETLMRLFVKLDLGYYPATWPIEDQAWYDALLVECGLLDVQTRFVPEGDEISLEQALEIVTANIKNHFHDNTDVTDESLYLRFVEYRQMIPEGVPLPRKWYIRYEALLPTLDSYNYVISTDGTIEEAGYEPGIYSDSDAISGTQVEDYYVNKYGPYRFEWSQEVWMALQRDMNRVFGQYYEEQAANPDHILAGIIYGQNYGTPDAQTIPIETATEAAIDAIVARGLLSRTELKSDFKANALYLVGASNPVWKICFSKISFNEHVILLCHAEVNAYTGEVQNIVYADPRASESRPWYEPYVLFETLPNTNTALAANGNDQPRTRSEGPDYYYGETYGYLFEWSQEVWRAVQRDLESRVDIGKSHRFTQAVLRQQYGAPDAQVIPMENAIKAAMNAIVQKGLIAKAELEADYTPNALCLIGVSQPIWKISFVKMLEGDLYAFDLFHAEVNAYTGEVSNIGCYELGENYFEPYVLYEVLELVDKEMPEQPELPPNG